jgi:hypothetical protein
MTPGRVRSVLIAKRPKVPLNGHKCPLLGGLIVTIAVGRNRFYSGLRRCWGGFCGNLRRLFTARGSSSKWRVMYGEQVEDQGERSGS